MEKQKEEALLALVSKPGLVAVGDFVDVSQRTGNNQKEYFNASIIVGSSTERFDIEPALFAQLASVQKYKPVALRFEEIRFRESGNVLKKAVEAVLL